MKKNLIVLQDGYKECGVACLLSIIRYYGGNISMSKLLDITNTNKFGTDFYNLKLAAISLGLDSKAYKIDDVSKLNEIKLPFICQIISNNFEHFVVVYNISRNKVTLMDPASGEKIININEFSKIWTSYVMIFSPCKKIPYYKDEKYLNRIIIDTLKTNKSLVLNILFLSLIFTIMSCIYAFYGQLIIDNISNTKISNLTVITFMFSIVILIKCLANFFRNLSLIYLQQKIDCSLFLNTFKKILLLPYNYYKNKTTGEVVSRINDLVNIKNLLSKLVLTVFLDFIISIVCSILLFKISKVMFLLLVIIIIEYIIIFYVFRPIAKKYTNILQENNALINSKMIESISGFETIKNLNVESIVNDSMEKAYVSSLNDVFVYDNLNSIEIFLKDIITLLGMLFVSYVGYKYVMSGILSVGEVITFISLSPYFIDPLKNLIDLGKESFYALNTIKRMNNLFDIDCEELERKNNLDIFGTIKITNLFFSYNNCDNILNDVSLKIKQGEKVLILGESGSGKSTILKLLYKYYPVKRNMIYIDNIDINDYDLEDIRSKVVYVSQDETLYTDTIKNNIILNRDIGYKEFLEICNLTHTDEVIKDLFLGYDTKLEENGLNISGGQRQRIILARALLKMSNIILIDEGLNAIDIDLERKILKNIFNKYYEKTIIIVSHRLENIDLYSRVFRLDNGRVIDEYEYPLGDADD